MTPRFLACDCVNGRSYHRRERTQVDKQVLVKNMMNVVQVIFGWVEL